MLPIGSHPAWHPIFETLAYATGYVVFRRIRARQGDLVDEPQRWTILAAAAVGALAGSRLLGLAEHWPTMLEAWQTGHLFAFLLTPGGKTVVGGLLGAWLGVEIIKRINAIHTRTGDLFALPLCVGIAVGRIGCLIAGLADDTYGKPTSLPPPFWAVNLGDDIPRYPVQLLEILFLILVGFTVSSKLTLPEGSRFRIFLASYLSWRLAIDFLKPQPLAAGLNLIQWSCIAGLLALAWGEMTKPKEAHEVIRT